MFWFVVSGRLIVVVVKMVLYIGYFKVSKVVFIDMLKFDFYFFDFFDIISCLDVYFVLKDKKFIRVDVVVGCVWGVIYLYNDVLFGIVECILQFMKFYWYWRVVYSVKLFRDGKDCMCLELFVRC